MLLVWMKSVSHAVHQTIESPFLALPQGSSSPPPQHPLTEPPLRTCLLRARRAGGAGNVAKRG